MFNHEKPFKIRYSNGSETEVGVVAQGAKGVGQRPATIFLHLVQNRVEIPYDSPNLNFLSYVNEAMPQKEHLARIGICPKGEHEYCVRVPSFKKKYMLLKVYVFLHIHVSLQLNL
jgi:hypothetical protein